MKPQLTVTDDYSILVMADGTVTQCEILLGDGHVLGAGSARRRKGDPRDPDLGEMLALERAFQDAAWQLRIHIAVREAARLANVPRRPR